MPASKYKPEFAERAAELAKLGATQRVLAAIFEVDEDTITNWKSKHPEFMRAFNGSAAEADLRVANSLYDQAIGYTYQTQECKVVKDKDGNERLEAVNVTKHVPAKTTAGIFWLKNRQPELWRDVQQVEHSGLDGLLAEIMNTSRGLPNAHASKAPRAPTQH